MGRWSKLELRSTGDADPVPDSHCNGNQVGAADCKGNEYYKAALVSRGPANDLLSSSH